MRLAFRAAFTVAILGALSAQAASFIVPDDRRLAQDANAIAVVTALHSYTELSDEGAIVTVTNVSVDDVLLGEVGGHTIDIREPGGVYEERATIIPGVPRFTDGERYLLFLMRERGHWHVLNLILGKFRFVTDDIGRSLLLRDESLREKTRGADEFIDYLRHLGNGGPLAENYRVETASQRAVVNAAFTANSYTLFIKGTNGARWNIFPSPVSFFTIGTEPGAPGNGITAVNASFAAWNNDPNSNINYVYAGADNSGSHPDGLSKFDGQNSIYFERDLTAYGAPAFSCSQNSYVGTLGVGGVTRTSGGPHAGPNGESFETTTEGDVEMNQGIANCTLLFSNGDFNTGVAHEVGHTLGFRHSDETRDPNNHISCSGDATLECSSLAIMKAFIPNGINATLQAWDQHAVVAVYPSSGGSAPPVPTNVVATAIAATSVQITWTAATGATSYDIYRKGPGNTAFTLVNNVTGTSYTDNSVSANSAYLYVVRSKNASGTSADSTSDLATTVIHTDDPLLANITPIKAIHLAQLRTAVNAVRALAGLGAGTYTDSAVAGTRIKATHINELRTQLDAAMSILGKPTDAYTDTITTNTTRIKAVHFQELRNRMK